VPLEDDRAHRRAWPDGGGGADRAAIEVVQVLGDLMPVMRLGDALGTDGAEAGVG
jgi:hypothetical protein